jgi:hypothetical protein
MQAPGSAIGLIVSVALAWHSDRARERGLHIALAMALSCAGCLWLALAPSTVGKNVLYGGYLMTAGTMGTGQAINAVSTVASLSFCGTADPAPVLAQQQVR